MLHVVGQKKDGKIGGSSENKEKTFLLQDEIWQEKIKYCRIKIKNFFSCYMRGIFYSKEKYKNRLAADLPTTLQGCRRKVDRKMMAATTTGAVKLCYSRRLKHSEKKMNSTKLAFYSSTSFSVSSVRESFYIRALDPRTEQEEQELGNSSPSTDSFTSQGDSDYLWKLLVGSLFGGAVIKYGSIVFPEITRPNIVQALTMISTPVLAAVWLLIKQSRAEAQR